MSNAQFLVENAPVSFVITETGKSGGPTRIKCSKMAVGGQPTDNNRLYSEEILRREISKLGEKVRAGQLLGSRDHPGDGRDRLESAVVRWDKLYMDGPCVVGEAQVLPTQAGRDMVELMRSGVPIGCSLRGIGRTTSTLIEGKKVDVVADDFELLNFDIVLSPAVEEAQLQLVESRQQKKRELTVEQKRMQQLAGVAGQYEWAEPRQDQPDGIVHSSVYDVADEKHKVSNPSNNEPEFRKRLVIAVRGQRNLEIDALEPYAEGSWAVFDRASGKILRCAFKENEKGEIKIVSITDDLPGRVRESIEDRQNAHAVLVEETMRDPAARSLMIARAGIR